MWGGDVDTVGFYRGLQRFIGKGPRLKEDQLLVPRYLLQFVVVIVVIIIEDRQKLTNYKDHETDCTIGEM